MPHPRKLIRDAVKAQLLNKTAAGTKIIKTRVVTWRPQDLPAIAIYTLKESVDPQSAETAPRELKRMPALVVECALKQSDALVAANESNMDDALDAFAWQVERAIAADDTLGGAAGDAVLAETDVEILREGDQLIGVIALTFEVEYHSYLPEAEDEPLDDFSTADIKYDVGGQQHPDDEAHDVLENLEA